ncbi:MAG: RidA family protein [Pseudomonadota bacterium]
MTIQRLKTGNRMSQAVIHGDTIYLAGQVAEGVDVSAQTTAILAQIDSLLAECGSDKTKILSATIWLTSMDSFGQMNAVWDAWSSGGHAPARACVEAKLASPDFLVEIGVIAAR